MNLSKGVSVKNVSPETDRHKPFSRRAKALVKLESSTLFTEKRVCLSQRQVELGKVINYQPALSCAMGQR